MDSYIRPHRHRSAGSDETLVALRGLFALMTFDDEGLVRHAAPFGSERCAVEMGCALAVIVEATVWHTVLALTPGAVLLECKAGPFDPDAAKDLAPWAPEEGTAAAAAYLGELRKGVVASRSA